MLFLHFKNLLHKKLKEAEVVTVKRILLLKKITFYYRFVCRVLNVFLGFRLCNLLSEEKALRIRLFRLRFV